MYYLHDIVKVPLCKIVVEMERHPRAVKDQNTINDYAEALLEGIKLPPIDVFRDGENYLLADGLHRLEAYKLRGFDHIPAIVHQGCKTEVLLHALGANADHGLRRTNADKRKAVLIALTDPDLQGLSDNQIAEICKVSQPFASKIRKRLKDMGYNFLWTRLTANGRKINVRKIGKKKKIVTGPTDPVKEKESAGGPPPETDLVTNPQGQNSGRSGDNTSKEETPGADQTNGALSMTNPALGAENGALKDTEPPVTTDEDGAPEDTEPQEANPGGSGTGNPPPETDPQGKNSGGAKGGGNQQNRDLKGMGPYALKREVIRLRDLTKKQESEINAQNSFIGDLKEQVEKLKAENEYLEEELQGSIKMGVGASGFLDTNPMNTDQIVTQA